MKVRRLAIIAAVLALTTGLAACASDSTESESASSAPSTTVTIGITDVSKDYWTTFTDLAAKEGITVKLQNFTD